MQDYNYLWHGCMEITLEISCCKYPPAHELHKYWLDNREVKKFGKCHQIRLSLQIGRVSTFYHCEVIEGQTSK